MGDVYTELEVQVVSVKPSGETVKMTLPLNSIPDAALLRDATQYHFEDDEDDYFFEEEEDGRKVA